MRTPRDAMMTTFVIFWPILGVMSWWPKQIGHDRVIAKKIGRDYVIVEKIGCDYVIGEKLILMRNCFLKTRKWLLNWAMTNMIWWALSTWFSIMTTTKKECSTNDIDYSFFFLCFATLPTTSQRYTDSFNNNFKPSFAIPSVPYFQTFVKTITSAKCLPMKLVYSSHWVRNIIRCRSVVQHYQRNIAICLFSWNFPYKEFEKSWARSHLLFWKFKAIKQRIYFCSPNTTITWCEIVEIDRGNWCIHAWGMCGELIEIQ